MGDLLLLGIAAMAVMVAAILYFFIKILLIEEFMEEGEGDE